MNLTRAFARGSDLEGSEPPQLFFHSQRSHRVPNKRLLIVLLFAGLAAFASAIESPLNIYRHFQHLTAGKDQVAENPCTVKFELYTGASAHRSVATDAVRTQISALDNTGFSESKNRLLPRDKVFGQTAVRTNQVQAPFPDSGYTQPWNFSDRQYQNEGVGSLHPCWKIMTTPVAGNAWFDRNVANSQKNTTKFSVNQNSYTPSFDFAAQINNSLQKLINVAADFTGAFERVRTTRFSIIRTAAAGTLPEVSISRNGKKRIKEGRNVDFQLNLDQAQATDLRIRVFVSQLGRFLRPREHGMRTVVIPAGQTSTEFRVRTDDDSRIEPTGTISGSVRSSAEYIIATGAESSRVTVDDNDGGPSLSISSFKGAGISVDSKGRPQIPEAGTSSLPGFARFTVNVNPVSSEPIEVGLVTKYSNLNSGRAAKSDISTSTVLIPSNTKSVYFDLPLVDDARDEQPKLVNVAIKKGSGYQVARAPLHASSIVILDNDPTEVSLKRVDSSLTEADATDSGELTILLSRRLYQGEIVSVPLMLSTTSGVKLPGNADPEFRLTVAGDGITATGTDTATPVVVLTGSNKSKIGKATVRLIPTSTRDNDKKRDVFSVKLGNPVGNGLKDVDINAVVQNPNATSAKVEILDSTPGVKITPVRTLTLSEGTKTSYTIQLLTNPNEEVEIQFRSDNPAATAVAGTAESGWRNHVNFNESTWHRPQTIHVWSVQDDNATDEIVKILHEVSVDEDHKNPYHNIKVRNAAVKVIDDDYLVALSLDSNSIVEGASRITITATLSQTNRTGSAVSIPIRLTTGSTATRDDFSLSENSIRIPQGAISGTTTFSATADNLDELSEVAIFEFGKLPNFWFADETNSVEISITDDNPTEVKLTVPDTSASEADATATAEIKLTLNRGLMHGESLIVPLTFIGAESGSDFSIKLKTPLPVGVSIDAKKNQIAFSGSVSKKSANEAVLLLTATDDTDFADEIISVSIPSSSDTAGLSLTSTGLDGGAKGVGSGNITLIDDDIPEVKIEAKSALAQPEGVITGFTVTASATLESDLTVLLNVSDDDQADYIETKYEGSQQVVIKAGAAQTDFYVATVNDTGATGDEPNGEIQVSIRESSANYSVKSGANVAKSRIIDNDATTVSLHVSSVELSEGEATKITVSINRPLVDGERLEIPLKFSGAALGETDFTLTGPSVLPMGVTLNDLDKVKPDQSNIARITFLGAAGRKTATSVSLNLAAKEDEEIESLEKITIAITFPAPKDDGPSLWSGLDGGVRVLTRLQAFQIRNTTKNKVELSIAHRSTWDITEGRSLNITATLQSENQTGDPIKIPLRIRKSGTSADASDYSLDGTITIANNAKRGSTKLSILEDKIDERIEKVSVEVAGPLPEGIARGRLDVVTASIIDNDPTVVSLKRIDSGPLAEGGTGDKQNAIFTVSLPRVLGVTETIVVPLVISGKGITTGDFKLTQIIEPYWLESAPELVNANTLTPSVVLNGHHTSEISGAKLALTPTRDDVVELPETMTVALGPAGTGVNGFASQRLTDIGGGAIPHATEKSFDLVIASETFPVVIIPQVAAISEDATKPGLLKITGDPQVDVTVALNYKDGTAKGGRSCGGDTDYDGSDNTIVLKAGVASHSFAVLPRCTDDKDEPNETYVITWTAAHPVFNAKATNCATSTVCTTTVTLIDDDVTSVELSIPDNTVSAGDFDDTASIRLTLSREMEKNEKISVPLSFTGATLGVDFILTLTGAPNGVSFDVDKGIVTFTRSASAKSATSATIELIYLRRDDLEKPIVVSIPTALYESSSTLLRDNLVDATGVLRGSVKIGTNSIVTSPSLLAAFKVTTATVSESVGTHHVRVNFTPMPEEFLTVKYSVSGTATEGEDYSISDNAGTTGSFKIPPFTTSMAFPIKLVDDGIDEGDETVVVTLKSGTGYTLAEDPTFTLTVQDASELPAAVKLSISAVDEVEEGQSARFTIESTAPVETDLDVNVSLAQLGDYVSADELGDRKVIIPAGKQAMDFDIPTIDDSVHESTGAISAILLPNSEYVLDEDSFAAVSVSDNDPVLTTQALLAAFKVTTATVSESVGTHHVRVNFTPMPEEFLTVKYSVSGTATEGEDYSISDNAGTTGSFKIPPFTTSMAFPIKLVDDGIDEGDETVVVTLKSGTGYTLAEDPTFTLTVQDSQVEVATEAEVTTAKAQEVETTGESHQYDRTSSTVFTAALSVQRADPKSLSRVNMLQMNDDDNNFDTPSIVAYVDRAAQVNENDKVLRVQVEISPLAADVFNINYSLSGTATPGVDYSIPGRNGNSGSFIVSQFSHLLTFPIYLTDDGVVEGEETIVVTLTAGSGYSVGSSAVFTLTLQDSVKPVITVTGSPAIQEGQSAVFTLTADTSPVHDLEVGVNVAESGDQVAESMLGNKTVTILAGTQTATLEIATTDDDIHEESSVITVSVIDGSGYITGELVSASVAVADDDAEAMIDFAGTWLVRYGRSVTSEVIEMLEQRFDYQGTTQGFTGKIAGESIDEITNSAYEGKGLIGELPGYESASKFDSAHARIDVPIEWSSDPHGARHSERHLFADSRILTDSNFAWVEEDQRRNSVGFWGRGFYSQTDGNSGNATVDVKDSGISIGLDSAGENNRRRHVAGALLSYSTGTGTYKDLNQNVSIESSLTTWVPYGMLEVTDRLKLWSAVGIGSGEVTYVPEKEFGVSTDIDWRMFALGFSQALKPSANLGINLYGDTYWNEIRSDQVSNLLASRSRISTARFGLKLNAEHQLSKDSQVEWVGSLALRQDKGDAERGSGLEVGIGMSVSNPRGIDVNLQARALALHHEKDFRDRGFSASFNYDPEPTHLRGLTGQFSIDFGMASHGEELHSGDFFPQTSNPTSNTSNWRVGVGYGFEWQNGLTRIPYVEFKGTKSLDEGRFGVRVAGDGSYAADLEFDLYVSTHRTNHNELNTSASQQRWGGGLDLAWRW